MSLIKLFTVFKDTFFTKFRKGNMYMITRGDYAGQCFVYLEKRGNEYGFLSIPHMENRWVPKESVEFGLENGIIDFIEHAPRYVRNICKAKFEENKAEVH